MPMYDYEYTDQTGGTFSEFQRMTEEALSEHNGRPCRRRISAPAVRTQFGAGNRCDPIKMLSIALDNEPEIDDFRRRNPGVEISSDRRNPDFGVPIATSRSQKLKILKNEGFVEKN